jgi:hypothetical protein
LYHAAGRLIDHPCRKTVLNRRAIGALTSGIGNDLFVSKGYSFLFKCKPILDRCRSRLPRDGGREATCQDDAQSTSHGCFDKWHRQLPLCQQGLFIFVQMQDDTKQTLEQIAARWWATGTNRVCVWDGKRQEPIEHIHANGARLDGHSGPRSGLAPRHEQDISGVLLVIGTLQLMSHPLARNNRRRDTTCDIACNSC